MLSKMCKHKNKLPKLLNILEIRTERQTRKIITGKTKFISFKNYANFICRKFLSKQKIHIIDAKKIRNLSSSV
jgi:hypothetical protein